jgi:5-methylcytosine-specific restriction endonuclease McrA
MGYTGEQKRQYQRQWLADRRQRAIEILGGRCVKCSTTEDLEIDHVVPASKLGYASIGGNLWSWSWTRIVKELARCQLLCKKCHKEKTLSEQRGSEHGTAGAYRNRKCRCDICKEWSKLSKRAYRARAAVTRETVDPPGLGPG